MIEKVVTHEDRIRKLVSTYDGVGDVVEHFTGLSGFYSAIKYTLPGHKDNLPPFLQEAIGPPLQSLPSYKGINAEAVVPEAGIGYALDEVHMEMRNLGKRMAKFLLGKNFASMTGDGNLRASIRRVEGGMEIPLNDADGNPTEHKLVVPGRVAEQLVMLGAISKQFMNRKDGERNLLDDSVGNAREVFDRMGSIQNSLFHMLEAQGLDDKIDLRPLRLNGGKIRKALQSEAEHFRDIRAFVKISRYGILTEDMRVMCALPDNGKTVDIENPKDAACTLFSLAYFADKTADAGTVDICIEQSEKLARATSNEEAAKLLNTRAYRHSIEMLEDHTHPSYRAVMESALNNLEDYAEKYRNQPMLAGEDKSSGMSRGGSVARKNNT